MAITRRGFLKASGAAVVTVPTGYTALRMIPQHVRVTHHRVRWRVAHPLRIAHLTDLHVGPLTAPELLAEAIAATNEARPDLVVLTGDYLNHSLEHLGGLVAFVNALPRPCVATLGNHDHWSGAQAISDALRAQTVAVLANESTVIDVRGCGLSIVGIDDGYTKHDDIERAFAGVEQREHALVLTHFPETAPRIAASGGRLVLAGHTHGCHLNVPPLTSVIARVAGLHYLSGWYAIDAARLYVNPGVGTSSVRIRVGPGTSPEVAILDLIPREEGGVSG